jgi:hypothetical protein
MPRRCANWVAKALVNKGITLGQLDRPTEAIAVYDQVVERYGYDPAPELRESVAAAVSARLSTGGEPPELTPGASQAFRERSAPSGGSTSDGGSVLPRGLGVMVDVRRGCMGLRWSAGPKRVFLREHHPARDAS